jgi:polyisoprenyl-teichoic acid--peptidoglycan teichoic acid transferase
MAARPRTYRLLAPCLGALLTLAACTSSGEATPGPSGSAAASGSSAPSASPSPFPEPAVTVRVSDARGEGPRGPLRPSVLDPAVQRVDDLLSTMFTIGFVNRDAWAGGRFTSLFRLFEADVRDDAHRDLKELTIGPLATAADGVNVTVANADLRFVANASGRPVVAIAQTNLDATARDGDRRAEFGQTGRWVLRWSAGEWRIAGYDVAAHVPAHWDGPSPLRSASFAPGIPTTRPLFLLVIGSDARPNQAVEHTRADSLHIVGIDPRSGRVSVLGIPRDTWTAIPGHGMNKINSSLTYGGPDLVVQTVEHLTGVPIDGYAITGFEGFVDLVDGIHGIDIRLPFPIHDAYAHANFKAGRTHLGGKEALALARARHAFRTGDFERSLNQGRLLIAAAATLAKSSRATTAPFVRWALEASDAVHTDLSIEDLFELLVASTMFDPSKVTNEVATGRVAMIGSQSVVLLDARATAMFRDLARDGVLDG